MDNKPHFTEEINLKIQQLMNIILAERFGDLDKDFAACTELLEICSEQDYTYGCAFAYAYMGDCLIGKNESVNASPHLMKAKELCEKHRYLDLLPYVCTWLGIYYEMQSDRQMAMHYYLDALEFAERNNDLLRQSILLNNIASQFQSCGNAAVAKEYYIKAFNCFNQLEHPNISDPHYAQMTANIISACCRLKQLDDATYYFTLLKDSGQLEENHNQLYLCELLISAANGDMHASEKNVDKLLIEMQKHPKNIHQLFETFLVVAESMVSLDEEIYAQKLLHTLDDMCQEDEYGHRLKVQYVWMRFYKKFGTQEEKSKAYEQFYELRQLSDTILNHNLSDGLLSKIKLRESVKQNQEMEKEKKLLEGEAQLDELTQLLNRRSFRTLTEEIAADPQVYSLSMIMIDVDYFKQYNDTYGHPKGDMVLHEVANSMTNASNSNVYNFRYGGDEFVSICKNMTVEEVESYVSSLSAILHHKHLPHVSSLCSSQVTLSIGYSFQLKQGSAQIDTVKLTDQADKALYQAKGLGRNCHCLYSPDMSKA